MNLNDFERIFKELIYLKKYDNLIAFLINRIDSFGDEIAVEVYTKDSRNIVSVDCLIVSSAFTYEDLLNKNLIVEKFEAVEREFSYYEYDKSAEEVKQVLQITLDHNYLEIIELMSIKNKE